KDVFWIQMQCAAKFSKRLNLFSGLQVLVPARHIVVHQLLASHLSSRQIVDILRDESGGIFEAAEGILELFCALEFQATIEGLLGVFQVLLRADAGGQAGGSAAAERCSRDVWGASRGRRGAKGRNQEQDN